MVGICHGGNLLGNHYHHCHHHHHPHRIVTIIILIIVIVIIINVVAAIIIMVIMKNNLSSPSEDTHIGQHQHYHQDHFSGKTPAKHVLITTIRKYSHRSVSSSSSLALAA